MPQLGTDPCPGSGLQEELAESQPGAEDPRLSLFPWFDKPGFSCSVAGTEPQESAFGKYLSWWEILQATDNPTPNNREPVTFPLSCPGMGGLCGPCWPHRTGKGHTTGVGAAWHQGRDRLGQACRGENSPRLLGSGRKDVLLTRTRFLAKKGKADKNILKNSTGRGPCARTEERLGPSGSKSPMLSLPSVLQHPLGAELGGLPG